MANATFVENWNSIIPHKIKASELEHPTESFVFRNIVSFLKMLKYDVTEFENMYTEPKDVLLLKRTNLVAHINYFYQLCLVSKQSQFFYVDLIKPSPKKTIHVLNILLNYLLYVNMVKDDAVERATHCTARYYELTDKMNQQRCEIENHKIKLSNIEQNICRMKDQLPQLEQENEKLRKKQEEVKDKIRSIKSAENDYEEKVIKLKTDLATLKEQRIEDEDAAALIQKNEELEAEIEECGRQEKSYQLANSEYTTLIGQIQPCILVLEDILQNPLDNSLSSIKAEVDTLQLNCLRLERDSSNKQTVLEALQKNCESIRAYLEAKEKEIEIQRKLKRKTERKTVADLSEKHEHYDELREKNDEHLEKIQVLKEEIQLIMQMADDTIKFLMRDPIKKESKFV
ncbi:filamin A-interacting protein 1-like [Wyeomyia smithii]|uniref:filamin A-interacting protein 1-like n=1 Tax=Wyeomyia smithii TaxID=174621 RepID=UPI002467DBA2|nr:filamin A-interacting protein 1-like [Wyeomyia smithii]